MIGKLAAVKIIGFTPAWLTARCDFLRANPSLITNANLRAWLAARGTSLEKICEQLPPKTLEKVQGLVVWFSRNPAKLTPTGLRVLLEMLHIEFGGPTDPSKVETGISAGNWWPRPYELVQTLFPTSRGNATINWATIYWWERIYRVIPVREIASLKPDFADFQSTYKIAWSWNGGYSEGMCTRIFSTLMRLAWKHGVPPVWYSYEGGWSRYETMEDWLKVPPGWRIPEVNFDTASSTFTLPRNTPYGTSTAGWSYTPTITISQ